MRHGESTWNAERRWTGHGDPPLSEAGRAEARAACSCFRDEGFVAVGSSTRIRASETGEIVSAGLGIRRLEPVPELDERFAGPLSGMTSTEMDARWPGLLDRWRVGEPVELPGGEPWDEFVERACRGLARLREFPGRLLVVAHMGVQRAIEYRLGWPLGSYRNLEGFWVAPELGETPRED